MMSTLIMSFLMGIISGAGSWAIIPLVSDSLEPFDSDIGFFIGQSALSIAAFYLGFSKGFKNVLIFVLAAYLGMNIYPYVFGSSEQRVWAGLGLLTAPLLCIYPFLSGCLGKIITLVLGKYYNAHK